MFINFQLLVYNLIYIGLRWEVLLMITSVWKLRPTSMWRISVIENWLSDMAKEGLHFYKMGVQFGKFKRGEAQDLLYRIELSKEEAPSDEDLVKYELTGWKYVTSFNEFHIYSSPKNSQTEPFPINHVKQLAVIRQKKKSSLLSCSFSLLLIIANVWLQIYSFSSGKPVILQLVEGYSSFHPLLIIPFVINGYLDVLKYRLMSKYQNQLLDNSAKENHVEWQWHLPKRIWGFIVYDIIIVGSLLLLLLPLLKMESKTLPAEDTQPYIVRLHMIEHPEILKLSNVPSEDYTFENSLSSDWSIFAPKYYYVREGFDYNPTSYINDDLIRLPRIYSSVYELRFSSIAGPLLHDLIKDTSRFENLTNLQEISHKQFDLLYVLEHDDYVKIYASKDSIVTYIFYNGNQNTDILIEKLASKFNE